VIMFLVVWDFCFFFLQVLLVEREGDPFFGLFRIVGRLPLLGFFQMCCLFRDKF